MSNKYKKFILVSHCLLNPYSRVHILGKSFKLNNQLFSYLLSQNISVIQLPCPEFTAMGFYRNPQGRMQYNNIFFKNHCEELLETPILMTQELINTNHTLLAYIGVSNSPCCSVKWGKHKTNKYQTESIMPDNNTKDIYPYINGVFSMLLKQKLNELDIFIPFLEAPIKSQYQNEIYNNFFSLLEDICYLKPTQKK